MGNRDFPNRPTTHQRQPQPVTPEMTSALRIVDVVANRSLG
jgi:hypothetical protein